MAYSLYLWHWPLLIFWLSYTGRPRVDFLEGAVVLLVSGVLAWLTTALRRGSAAVPRRRRRQLPSVPLRSRLRRPTIVLGSMVALLGVALTATSFTWREHVTVQRANGKELSGLSIARLPRRPRAAQPREGAQAADAPDGARGQERPAGDHHRRLHQRLRQHRRDQLHVTATSRRPGPSRWPADRTPSTGSPRSTCWAGCTTSRW